MDKVSFTVWQPFFRGVGIFTWIGGWSCLYFEFDFIFSLSADVFHSILMLTIFFVLLLLGPCVTILFSLKVVVENSCLTVYRFFGLIKKHYTFDSIKRIKIRPQKGMRIEFNDGFLLGLDCLLINYNKLLNQFINKGLIDEGEIIR